MSCHTAIDGDASITSRTVASRRLSARSTGMTSPRVRALASAVAVSSITSRVGGPGGRCRWRARRARWTSRMRGSAAAPGTRTGTPYSSGDSPGRSPPAPSERAAPGA
ncbi:hypothetical protein [Streptomyces avidinii]